MIPVLIDRPLVVVSCIQVPYRDAVRHLKGFFACKPGDWKFREFPGPFQLERIYTGMPPAGGSHKKRVGVIDKQGTTVMVANLQDGWSSLAYVLSAKTGTDAYIFKMSDAAKVEHPIDAFTYLAKGYTLRHVSLIKEDKWVFYQQGNPLPEEDIDTYKHFQKSARFSAESVVKIGNNLGFKIGDVSFYEDARGGVFSDAM